MVAVLHFWLDLALVEIEDSRSEILGGVVEGNNHFLSIFSNGSHVRVPFEVWVE